MGYNNNLRRVTDYKRVTFVCETFSTISSALRLLDEKHEIVRIKNRFSRDNRTAKETAGYRDLQIVVRHFPSRLLVEVQLHLSEIHKLKSEVSESSDGTGRTGHERYIEFRTIKEKAVKLYA